MNLATQPITRREALKASAGIIAGAAVGSVTPTLAAETTPKASRIREYSSVRGFNYQPSWGSHGITIWNDFREATYAKELDLGLKQAGIGFLPHALHHSPVADLHRPVPGRKWETLYMAFIDPDGTIRPGHEVYNEFCQ